MNNSNITADILERIPNNEGALATLSDICSSTDKATINYARGVISLLQTFNALTVYEQPTGDLLVKACSETASYFIKSLAHYVRNDLKIIAAWNREDAGEDPHISTILDLGVRFLYVMENRRVSDLQHQAPIREIRVASVIIKANVHGQTEPMYLVQYDHDAHQYQLIGGRGRSTKEDPKTIATRAIDRELSSAHLIYGSDYELEELKTGLRKKEVSHTYGVYTEYDFTIFRAIIKKGQLRIRGGDKWVSEEELLANETHDGDRIASGGIDQLPGGIQKLPLSIEERQQSSQYKTKIDDHEFTQFQDGGKRDVGDNQSKTGKKLEKKDTVVDPTELTIGMILKSMKPAQLWAIGVALVTLFSGVGYLAYYAGTLAP